MEVANIRSIPIVGKFLIDPSVLEHLEGVQDKYGLPVARSTEYLLLTRAVLDGDITLEHMPEMIGEAFGVDADKAKKIACDVAGYRLLPLEGYFPGTAAQITAWGGKLEDYPAEPVGKEKVVADRFAGRLTEDLALSLQPNHIKRLGFLVKSYYSSEKNREGTLTFFVRPATIGGLGLPPEQAKALMAMVDENKDFIELVESPEQETFQEDGEETPSDSPVTGGEPQPSDTPPFMEGPGEAEGPGEVTIASEMHLATTTPVKPEVILSAPSVIGGSSKEIIGGATAPRREAADEDKQDIAQHEKIIAKKDIVDPAKDTKLDEAVNIAVEAASTALQEKRVAKKKFADVAKMAIRGVRDTMQTRGVLERELGFTDPALDGLMDAIEQGAEKYHASPGPSINGGEKAIIGGATAPRPAAPTQSDVLDKRFAEVTKTMPTAPLEGVSEARVSAARTSKDETSAQAAKVDPAKLEVAAEASKPKLATAMLTVGSVPPPLKGEQSRVTDVQFRHRLAGPVDELGTMLPADFRRLSSDPVEAAKKVEDLLASLETTSYEERIRGIQAWRASPTCKLYVAMAEDALQAGVALAEVASRRRNSGAESLSPAEMKAIGSLNARIRF